MAKKKIKRKKRKRSSESVTAPGYPKTSRQYLIGEAADIITRASQIRKDKPFLKAVDKELAKRQKDISDARRRGFTLIELMMVILYIGVFAYITLPRVHVSMDTIQNTVCKLNANTINEQIEVYAFLNEGIYPHDVRSVTREIAYFPGAEPECPLGGTYLMNGLTYRVVCDHN